MDNNFINWIKSDLPNVRIETNKSSDEKELAALEKEYSISFPEEYRSLLLYSNGATFYGHKAIFYFFNIEVVSLLNDDPDYSDRLNGLNI